MVKATSQITRQHKTMVTKHRRVPLSQGIQAGSETGHGSEKGVGDQKVQDEQWVVNGVINILHRKNSNEVLHM